MIVNFKIQYEIPDYDGFIPFDTLEDAMKHYNWRLEYNKKYTNIDIVPDPVTLWKATYIYLPFGWHLERNVRIL